MLLPDPSPFLRWEEMKLISLAFLASLAALCQTATGWALCFRGTTIRPYLSESFIHPAAEVKS